MLSVLTCWAYAPAALLVTILRRLGTSLVSVISMMLTQKGPKPVVDDNSIFDIRHVLYLTTPKQSTSELNVLKLSSDAWYRNYDHNRWDNFNITVTGEKEGCAQPAAHTYQHRRREDYPRTERILGELAVIILTVGCHTTCSWLS